MTTVTYTSTPAAYDASQTVAETGTILVIEAERVVGISWTWPIAITVETGALHALAPNGVPERLLRDAQISWADLKAAYVAASERGYEVAAWVVAIAKEREWPAVLPLTPPPPAFTSLRKAQAELRPLRIMLRCIDGEYQVKPQGSLWDGDGTYFTNDLDDAVGTGRAMAKRRDEVLAS